MPSEIVTARLPNSGVSHAVSILAGAVDLTTSMCCVGKICQSWALAKCGQSSADELDLFASIRARTNNVQYFASWEVRSACLRNVPGHVSLR